MIIPYTNKHSRAVRRQITKATKPLVAGEHEEGRVPDEANIDTCLNCPYMECLLGRCELVGYKSKRVTKRNKLEQHVGEIIDMLDSGLSYKAMSERLGVDKRVISEFVRGEGLC